MDGVSHDRIYVKPDKIKNLNELEKKYYRLLQRKNDFQQIRWHYHFHAILNAGGKAHAIPNNEYTGEQEKWWLFDIDENGAGWDWVDKPENPIHLELGQNFYKIWMYSSTVYSRVRKYNIALQKALMNVIDEKLGTENGYHIKNKGKGGQQLTLFVNYRHYWYKSEYDKNGHVKWDILSWPSHDAQVIVCP